MILDTNAVSALFAGHAGLEAVLADRERIHVPVIVLGEYRYGIKGSRSSAKLDLLLDQLESESDILHVDPITARTYAEIRKELKAAGRPIPENDIWIAALARQHDLPVVSRDSHFDHVKKLTRVDWEA